jgi:hypothetical protein
MIAWQPRVIVVHADHSEAVRTELEALTRPFRGRVVRVKSETLTDRDLKDMLDWALTGSGLRKKS